MSRTVPIRAHSRRRAGSLPPARGRGFSFKAAMRLEILRRMLRDPDPDRDLTDAQLSALAERVAVLENEESKRKEGQP